MGKFTSRDITVNRRIGSEKDPLETEEKSGIYRINSRNCNKVDIGQTMGYSEKLGANTVRLAVTMHIIEEGYSVTADSLERVRHVNKAHTLDTRESQEIMTSDL